MVTTDRPTDRVNIEQSAMEDGIAEFCKNIFFVNYSFVGCLSRGIEGTFISCVVYAI